MTSKLVRVDFRKAMLPERRYLTTAEAAAFCGMTTDALRMAAHRGKVRCSGKRGGGHGTNTWAVDELERFMTALSAPAESLAPPVTVLTGPGCAVIYFVQSGTRGPIKIGKSVDLYRRLHSLQTGSPEVLTLLAVVAGGCAEEQTLHSRFSASRYRGEWFRPTSILLAHVRDLQQRFRPAPRGATDPAQIERMSSLVLGAMTRLS